MLNNTTVARIVDMMFEDTEMTEEVAALHDEVMNNCQERYHDMIAAGEYEDDAIASVVESLKGMEDVIAQYKRKARKATRQTAPESTTWTCAAENITARGERDLTFSPAEISRIELNLVSEDVEVEESRDGLCHVRWDCGGEETITCAAKSGTIRIERIPGVDTGSHHKANININRNGGHVYVDGEEMDFADATGVMEKVGRLMGRIFGGMKSAFNACDTVTIAIPEGMKPHMRLVTTSGNISVMQVELADLEMTTVSGDVDVDLDESAPLPRMSARSTSGDVELTAFVRQLTASSTSGDVSVEGRIAELTVSTISGDLDVRADVESIEFKAISGDVDLEFDSDGIRRINGSTISGDIDVDLPNGLGCIAINTNTRSGDVTTRHATNGVGPTVTGSISSMSGDITIR